MKPNQLCSPLAIVLAFIVPVAGFAAPAPDDENQSLPPLPQTGLPVTGPAQGIQQGKPQPTFWNQDELTGTWDGLRDRLQKEGISLTPTYIGEVMGNPSGGARQGLISDGIINMALDVNPEPLTKLAFFNDTLIHANALYSYGTGLSNSYVGDFSDTSNIATYNTVRLQELSFQKKFWNDQILLRMGNMAVDTRFFASYCSSLFINGTFGAFTLIGNNIPNAPIYPVASPGIRLGYTNTRFYVMSGVYGMDNNSNPNINNKYGTRFALDSASGMLIMSEGGFLLNQTPEDKDLQGSYRIGSFVHSANYTTWQSQAEFNNGVGPLRSAGANYGVYGVLDQQIYRTDVDSIGLFVRSGGAPSDTNLVDYYVDGGFNFTGFIPDRPIDVAGIAIARSHISKSYSNSQVAEGNRPSTAETVIEATYRVQISPWWSIQPDLQYIITPSGVEGSKNATVIGLRTSVVSLKKNSYHFVA